MSAKRIYILTEGGGSKGLGHISRCLSLSQAFTEYGFASAMVINGEGIDAGILAATNAEELDWITKEEEILSMTNQADLVIIDSYICPQHIYQKIAAVVSVAAYIDDTLRIDYPEGIVINGVLNASELNYPLKKGLTYLLGKEYSFLRKEFWNVPEKQINAELHSVMVSCGGNDENGFSYQIVKTLVENYPSLHIKVILKNREMDKFSYIKEHATVLTELDADEMKTVMMESDIAVTASGQTTYELCRIGTPFIALVTADNQWFSIGHFHKKGLIQEPICSDDAQLEKKILDQLKILSSHTTRQNLHDKMKQTISGRGSLNVVDHLLKTINNY
ncbi:MAG: UDP-2,4-diacetamido-2,4,6-trideoxy-beta-L-altropyranose hydrolase [Bacteroidota bacterium]